MKLHHLAGATLLALLVACLSQTTLNAQDSATPKPATVTEYLSDLKTAKGNIAEYQGKAYGFFINKNGVIIALHEPKGKILFDSIGDWVLQRKGREHVGWIFDLGTKAKVVEGKEGANKVFNIEVIHPRLLQKTKIVCRETGPEITTSFEIVDFSDGVGLNFSVKLNAANVEGIAPNPTENPATFATKDGATISIGYNKETYSPYGNKGNGAYAPGKSGLNFYPKFGGIKEPGAKDTLTLDIQVP